MGKVLVQICILQEAGLVSRTLHNDVHLPAITQQLVLNCFEASN